MRKKKKKKKEKTTETYEEWDKNNVKKPAGYDPKEHSQNIMIFINIYQMIIMMQVL